MLLMRNASTTGSTIASVLPEPVGACTHADLPPIASAQTAACTGAASWRPSARNPSAADGGSATYSPMAALRRVLSCLLARPRLNTSGRARLARMQSISMRIAHGRAALQRRCTGPACRTGRRCRQTALRVRLHTAGRTMLHRKRSESLRSPWFSRSAELILVCRYTKARHFLADILSVSIGRCPLKTDQYRRV